MYKLKTGLPIISEYKKLLETEEFRKMEEFSDVFLERNKEVFKKYSWVFDSLHQWSRQWEYPFVFQNIEERIKSTNQEKVSILDLGSGATFFPFYLQSKHPGASIFCVDSDEALVDIYEGLNRNEKTNVSFIASDIRKMPLSPGSLDVVYCISVLEHTNEYRTILEEIKRLLKPGGLFILTFDISIDGDTDVPVSTAKEILSQANSIFPGSNNEEIDLGSCGDNLLSTLFFRGKLKKLLPWRWSFRYALYLIKETLRLKRPKVAFRKLTIWTGVYKKDENLHN